MQSRWSGLSPRRYECVGDYLKDIRKCPIPLPPVAELRRIAAKVDELMAVLDALEAVSGRIGWRGGPPHRLVSDKAIPFVKPVCVSCAEEESDARQALVSDNR